MGPTWKDCYVSLAVRDLKVELLRDEAKQRRQRKNQPTHQNVLWSSKYVCFSWTRGSSCLRRKWNGAGVDLVH